MNSACCRAAFTICRRKSWRIYPNWTRHRKALDHLARHDTLTGLPNRRMFFDRLEHAIVSSRRSGKHLAVLFVDLDRFKEINDTLGHAAGDSVLVNFAKLLKATVREADTVARLGGDEFVILLDSINDPQQVMVVVRKLHDLFQGAMQIEGHEINTSMPASGSAFTLRMARTPTN